MIILPGSRAFSDFNKNKLLKILQKSIPELTDIHARYWHFVKMDQTLSNDEHNTLESLLHYSDSGVEPEDAHEPVGELFLVVPRIGTISPWSSKATDILHNCGLTSVSRVERGIAYFIEHGSSAGLSGDERIFVR